MKHIIQVLVENKFGVLARIASLFSARGYNIDSLSVGETQDTTQSCMTIVVDAADERILEQIKKQLHKLIDVVTVVDFTHREHIERALLLARGTVSDTKALAEFKKKFPACIVQERKKTYTIELCVDTASEEAAVSALRQLGITELVRAGRIAIRV